MSLNLTTLVQIPINALTGSHKASGTAVESSSPGGDKGEGGPARRQAKRPAFRPMTDGMLEVLIEATPKLRNLCCLRDYLLGLDKSHVSIVCDHLNNRLNHYIFPSYPEVVEDLSFIRIVLTWLGKLRDADLYDRMRELVVLTFSRPSFAVAAGEVRVRIKVDVSCRRPS